MLANIPNTRRCLHTFLSYLGLFCFVSCLTSVFGGVVGVGVRLEASFCVGRGGGGVHAPRRQNLPSKMETKDKCVY